MDNPLLLDDMDNMVESALSIDIWQTYAGLAALKAKSSLKPTERERKSTGYLVDYLSRKQAELESPAEITEDDVPDESFRRAIQAAFPPKQIDEGADISEVLEMYHRILKTLQSILKDERVSEDDAEYLVTHLSRVSR